MPWNEAERVPVRHLLALQEGVSADRFREMGKSGVRLGVPAGLWKHDPRDIRPGLAALESFIGDVRHPAGAYIEKSFA